MALVYIHRRNIRSRRRRLVKRENVSARDRARRNCRAHKQPAWSYSRNLFRPDSAAMNLPCRCDVDVFGVGVGEALTVTVVFLLELKNIPPKV